MKRYHENEIEVPEGCTVSIEDRVIIVKGPKGEVKRNVKNKLLKNEIKDNKVLFYAEKASKNYKKIIATFTAHLKNLIKGVTQGHIYKLKICAGHFPMTVSVKGDIFEIKNFIGEAKPRKLKIKQGAAVKVDNKDITVEGINKEIVSQVAADIEKLTKRSNFDRRIFQDGIYITEKDGKKIGK